MLRISLLAALLASSGLAQAQSLNFNVDPSHTFSYFEIRHNGTSTIRGRFDKKEGTVSLDRTAKTGKAEITLDVNSLSTGVPPLDAHLKNKDFFNAPEFPTIKFVGDKFSFDGDKVTGVSGTLTLLGKTQPATLKATFFNCYENARLKREVCGGDFETTIIRSAYGMTNGLPRIPDEVTIKIQIEAIRAE